MSALTTPPAYAWPADVLEYARETGVETYLEPLRLATERTFPTGKLAVYVEDDPELRDVRWIVYEVAVPARDLGDPLAARHRWVDEKFALVPGPLICTFGFSLVPVES